MTAATKQKVSLGSLIKDRVDALARFSEDPENLTRLYLTPAHRSAAEAVMDWMLAAGMTARIDAIGNVVGRYEGQAPGAPALLTGSHIDTVRDAGAYDGNLGVALPVACIGELHAREERLAFAVEVIAFGDEEGVRFPTTLSGSRAVAGTFDPSVLDLQDDAGVTLADALRGFGGDPDAVDGEARRREDVLAFVEVHIEQGPVLEDAGLPLGVVTAISGAGRFTIEVGGMAGHAGTLPMDLRRDALAGAAEMLLAIERRAGESAGLVATAGRLDLSPGAANVVPGHVRFTLDIRAPEDALRHAALNDIREAMAAIARRRNLTLEIEEFHEAAAVACAPALMTQLEDAITRCGHRPLRLPSGAGHDAMAMAELCPVAMMFLRCDAGISHNPAESVTTEDVDVAARAFLDFLRHFRPPETSR